MPSLESQTSLPPTVEEHDPTQGKAKVIGLYGVSGSGKTFLLNQLKQELDTTRFIFCEGSELIADLVPGGLDAFRRLDEQYKTHWRQLAVDRVRKRCTDSGQTAVVAGHYMLWPEGEQDGCVVWTPKDEAVYTHIIYLQVPAHVIEQRRRDDADKQRPPKSLAHLLKWQQAEKAQLQTTCRNHGILFSSLDPGAMPSRLVALLNDFDHHTEENNFNQAEIKLDEALVSYGDHLQTMLVLDADRTLAAEDTGALFWTKVFDNGKCTSEEYPLKSLFSSPLAYSYEAFRQAVLLCEGAVDDLAYEAICQHVAEEVTIHPEFVSLFQLVCHQEHIGAIVVSCGLRRVWEKVLEREGLSRTVKIIAGGRVSDSIVVTAAVKAAIVSRLQNFHRLHVWAFGDSPLDMDMLRAADHAIVVVGDELARSKTMEAVLSEAIDQDGFRASQVTLPGSVSPRLSTVKLPPINITGIEFIKTILKRRDRFPGLSVLLAPERSAKLLATSMRDAAVAGPALRKAHRQVGWYLACEFLTRIIGLEDCQISHVLGHATTGYRLLDEQRTTIVALMRAGEPMASGVSKAFPLAMYVHGRSPHDVKPHHVHSQRQIVLVDSVVNSGKTVVEFVQAIRDLDDAVRIIVVAGVVQAQCVSSTSTAYKTLSNCGNINIVALRLSKTKFTGSGSTDTGNRLFNTTHLA
ncbi:uracil phosphoribosyltransferase-domain-containing protein [Clohesyomyces aquaticus]|uniref:Uracil phosphoribosyltransferase-domain-containing protein n=1 Tax=Clohesyomyces aquaticus TaxID=1231657 RepID=A0A1Y1YC39_9PLEO|nr:uracil phosphoribosyltransferase-domain-containing protein [Clohesyomyces aquaticus]